MDLKSEWVLGEFRDPPIELRLPERRSASGAAAGRGGGKTSGGTSRQPGDVGKASSSPDASVGGRRRVLSTRSAYQGERLAGLLVVKFEAVDEERRSRWRQFGSALNVELEITTEAVAAAGTAFLSEEPSLWRDYEGRENARDRGVLARRNHTISLSPESSRKKLPTEDLVYTLDVEVQVPVEFLGQRVYLEALVSPVSESQRESGGPSDPASASTLSRNAANAPSSSSDGPDGGGGANSGGGRRRGVGGDFANRLDGLFALSRVAPVRFPVRRCFLPLRVVQPITVTSRSCPCSSPSSSSAAAAAAAASCSAFAGAIGRCLVAVEVRNDHPSANVTLHDVEVHVDATARCGERASSRGFSAPGKAVNGGVGGGGSRVGVGERTRKMSGAVLKGGKSAPLEGLDGSIEQPPLAGGAGSSVAGTSFSRVFCASWVAKPPLPLELAPGEVQGFVLSISPAGETPLPPRRAGGRFESPVTFVWTLDTAAGGAGGKKSATAAAGPAWPAVGSSSSSSASSTSSQRRPPPSASRSRSPSPVPGLLGGGSLGKKRPPPRVPRTSVHLAQWQSERRARDEVLVRVNGQPRVKLNHVFEVFLRVRNLSDTARDLVVMFTEEAPDLGLRRGSGGVQQQLPSLDGTTERSGGRGRRRTHGGISVGTDTDSDDNDDDDVGGRGGDGGVKDISPSASPVRHRRGGGFTSDNGILPPPARSPPRRSADAGAAAGTASASATSASTPTSLLTGDLLPVDSAVPLGRLERGAEHGATVRLTAARAGLARLSSLCLRDSLTGSVYVPACPFEVFVES